jgi:YVTN family beta-propeller protein
VRRTLKVGEHPGSMVLSPDGNHLYVACANTNSVWVVNLQTGTAEEQISVALYPQAPIGSTPSALSISSDGTKLLVTNSDNNAVAVVDVSRKGNGKVTGFIPTGWYPTAAIFSKNNSRIFVLSGKGLQSTSNPRGPEEPNYIGQLLLGALSIIENPNADQLSIYTKTVYDLTPYSDAIRLTPPRAPEQSPIPKRIGDPSPIKYVFYMIRENRTYDQIFGDMKEGNGDPNLCLFGENITPNAHALAKEFVLFDNFYVDAEVSADGHAFSTGAYANDFIEKTWPMNYAERGADYLTEGGGAMRNPYGNIAAPSHGYLWDVAMRRNITVRSYGEFAKWNDPEKEEGKHTAGIHPGVPGLKEHINMEYPAWDLKIPDNRRVDIWLKEFQQYEEKGELPQLTILHLPNDHTAGTYPGYPTPRAMVAENDLALGRMVEAITHSRFWKESVIFVLEDDAQDGPDHVDAHRSVALVIGPYLRRKSVDSSMYTTTGMLRTIELILGIEPMSQYDASAAPMYAAFQNDPNFTPYKRVPARISLEETNASADFGAADSMAMNLKEADRIPMRLMNEILWKSVKGRDSLMPPPVRAAFVHQAEEGDR